MFERYTEKARRVIVFARSEASLFGSPYIETEHLLLGLLREDKSLTFRFLWLSVIAYNLGNLWRRLVLPRKIENWSLTSLQQRLVKTDGRLVKHARYYWLLLAESHLTRRLFGVMVRRIAGLPVPTG
jgi:ATP-dependent Clp protease ATP-binding subunit ClpA